MEGGLMSLLKVMLMGGAGSFQVETGDLQLSDALTDDNSKHTIVVGGDTQLTGTDPLAGTYSILSDGTGDYHTASNEGFFNVGTGDFTYDCLLELNSLPTGKHFAFFAQIDSYPNDAWRFGLNGTNLLFVRNDTQIFNLTVTPVIGERTHAALVRKDGIIYMYYRGILIDSKAFTSSMDFSAVLSSGTLSTLGDASVDGKIDMWRFTPSALWTTTNFNLSDEGLYYPSGTLQI
jgi:hypothetical protein